MENKCKIDVVFNCYKVGECSYEEMIPCKSFPGEMICIHQETDDADCFCTCTEAIIDAINNQ